METEVNGENLDVHRMHIACTFHAHAVRMRQRLTGLTGRVMTDGARHLAQLNVGRLVAETDDPRVAEFMAALDRVNGLGKRMPGFVWMMEGSGEPGTGNTETKIGGDPRFVSNLTVWESVEALEHFVWNTVHRQFYERRRGVVRGAGRRCTW